MSYKEMNQIMDLYFEQLKELERSTYTIDDLEQVMEEYDLSVAEVIDLIRENGQK